VYSWKAYCVTVLFLGYQIDDADSDYFFVKFIYKFSAKRNCNIESCCGNIYSLLVICIGFGTVQEAASGFFGCN